MSYHRDTYTIDITSAGVVNVIKRSNSEIQKSITLSTTNNCRIEQNGDEFTANGSTDAGDLGVANTGVSGNTVTMTDLGIIENIGQDKEVELDNYICFFKLEGTQLVTRETEV